MRRWFQRSPPSRRESPSRSTSEDSPIELTASWSEHPRRPTSFKAGRPTSAFTMRSRGCETTGTSFPSDWPVASSQIAAVGSRGCDSGCHWRAIWRRALAAQMSSHSTCFRETSERPAPTGARSRSRHPSSSRSAKVAASGGIEQDVVSYEPEIDLSGLLTDTPTWTFTAPARPGLTGSKELFLILKTPKGGAVTAKFAIGAEVASDLGPLSLRRRDEDAEMERRFTLIP